MGHSKIQGFILQWAVRHPAGKNDFLSGFTPHPECHGYKAIDEWHSGGIPPRGVRGRNKGATGLPPTAASPRGFILTEVVMVMLITAVLASTGAWLMAYLVQNAVFIPNKLNMDMLASDALDIMIEGDSRAKGLRFSKSITAPLQDNRVEFVNQDGQSIVYRLDTATNKLYRSIAGSERPLPYYLTTGINITGKDNKLFSYYEGSEAEAETETAVPANVRRIKINLVAKTGTGSFQDWEGQSEQSSSVAVKRF